MHVEMPHWMVLVALEPPPLHDNAARKLVCDALRSPPSFIPVGLFSSSTT